MNVIAPAQSLSSILSFGDVLSIEMNFGAQLALANSLPYIQWGADKQSSRHMHIPYMCICIIPLNIPTYPVTFQLVTYIHLEEAG